MLAKAQHYGVNDAAQMSPAELDRLLLHLERQQASLQRQEPKPEPVEDPIDWGTDADGKPMTEADYSKPVARAIRNAHKVEQLEKANKELQTRLERQEAERASRAATRQLNKVLSARADLFGETPGEADPNSPEGRRYRMVIDQLNQLVSAKQHTTLEADVASILEVFGPSPKPAQKPASGRPTLLDYRQGELGQPTARRDASALSQRERMIQEEVAKRRENGVYQHVGPDDDDSDLLPAFK